MPTVTGERYQDHLRRTSIVKAEPRVALLVVAFAVATAWPLVALASTWQLISVAQPIRGESMIEIRDVLFGFDSFEFGSEVELTCRRNSIRMVGEEFDVHSQNLNVASRYGLSVTIDHYLESVSRARKDTLFVRLDASHIDKSVDRYISADSVVAATVACLRINAARTPDLDYLSVRIQGPKRLQAMGGIFAVSDQPRRRAFSFAPLPQN